MTVGPTPPYNNPPINPQYFAPSQFFIQNITLGPTTTVTTVVNHNYVIGQLVRLLIPQSSGCRQLNQQAYVIAIPAPNQVVLDIFSQGGDIFKTSTSIYQPQILATGDINSGIIVATGRYSPTTTIPGSFVNISPA